ncbi:MAG: prolipoprotein diacylglyceryl transferase, partial [Leptospiraceae bacterium]|nr:prolipoprotein diacylglyceryl transferase [Leptospiraceae bacterium]
MNWNIDPVLLDLKIVKLRYYSLLFATGLFAAYFLVSKFLREKGLPNDYPDKIFIRIVISLVIGAHLVHLIFYEPSAFIHNPMRIFEIGSGLASHGGVLGALFGLWLFCHKYKESFFE